MKSIRIVTAAALAWLLTVTLPLAAADFRGLDWGASPDQVRAIERHPRHHDIDDEIAYWNFKLAGVEAGLVYRFEDDKLVRAYFLSRHQTSDPAEHLEDYLTFKRQNDEHFGVEGVEEWVWVDGRDHTADEQTLEEIVAGRAQRVTRWERETSRVRLVIAGGQGEIQTVRMYFEPR